MFSGGDYEEVARWLHNFVRAHAKRENLRVEAVVETEGPRGGQSYGVRLRLGDQCALRRLETQVLGDVGGDRLDLHADPSAHHRALVPELRHHVLHGVSGDRKSDAD